MRTFILIVVILLSLPVEARNRAHSPTSTTRWAHTCVQGSCRGTISTRTGRPRTVFVREYTTKNAVFKGATYRSPKGK